MKQIAIALAILLPLGVMADTDDDTLRSLFGKADLVILGKIVSEPTAIIYEAGIISYICDFAVEDVLKGESTLANTTTTIKVEITRFEMDQLDHDPLIKKDSRCILFLKKRSHETIPKWVTSDFWLGVQHPFPSLIRSLKRLAKGK